MKRDDALTFLDTVSGGLTQIVPGTRYQDDFVLNAGFEHIRSGALGDERAYGEALRTFDALWIGLFTGYFGALDTETIVPMAIAVGHGQRQAQFGLYGIDSSDLQQTYSGQHTKYLLYLRPHSASGRFYMPNFFPTSPRYYLSLRNEPPYLTFEASLNRVFFPRFATHAAGGLPAALRHGLFKISIMALDVRNMLKRQTARRPSGQPSLLSDVGAELLHTKNVRPAA